MGVSKNRGKTPKMDGENNGKPYEQMDDLGGKPTIFGNIHIPVYIVTRTVYKLILSLDFDIIPFHAGASKKK